MAAGPQRRPGAHPRRDRPAAWSPPTPSNALNEGRGRTPDETGSGRRGPVGRVGSLNEGRGRTPDETRKQQHSVVVNEIPSTKAGGAPPTRHDRYVHRGSDLRPLNEGRGRTPDETWSVETRIGSCFGPQRRPGAHPRRDPSASGSSAPPPRASLNEGRGRTPDETGAEPIKGVDHRNRPQRRPGAHPRRDC